MSAALEGRMVSVPVAVTGAVSGVGRRVVECLLAPPRCVGPLVAIDQRDEPSLADLEGIVWRILDLADPSLPQALAGVDAVVHCALDTRADVPPSRRRRRNIERATALLEAAAQAGVARVALVSSAVVYGALPDNPVPLPEDAPLRATPDETVLGDLLELEGLAARHRARGNRPALTVLRPAALLGPGVDNPFTYYMRAPRLLVVRGANPRWQFCHLDDLAGAIEHAVQGRVEGEVAVGYEGSLAQVEVEAIIGKRRLELPESLVWTTAERLHRLGLVAGTAAELAYLVHPWVVEPAKLRAAGWTPSFDNASALRAQRALGRAAFARDGPLEPATAAGAGASVAVVRAAAFARAARRRRHR